MPAMVTSLDLSSLYRSPVFRTSSTEKSHHELSRAISDHQVRWGRGRVAAEFHRRELRGLSMMLLTYGAEVEVRPSAFPDFSLVQMPLVGTTEIECDGRSLSLNPGEVALLSPREDLRLLWSPQCQQVIVKIPHQLAQPQGGDGQSPWATSAFKLRPEQEPVWQAMVQQLLALIPAQQKGVLHEPWVDRFESSLVDFLQTHQPGSIVLDAPAELPRADLQRRAAMARLDRLEAHLDDHLAAPLTLADLAGFAGVGVRTLNAICNELRGCTPMELLRQHRLEVARRRLQTEPGVSVTDVALECGFTHLGRFSAYYRVRFGEPPGDTRLKAWAQA